MYIASQQQAIQESRSLFELNKITFPDFKSNSRGTHMFMSFMFEQLFVVLRNQCDCNPIPPRPLPQSKTNDCAVAL